MIFIFTTRKASFEEPLKSALLIKVIHIPTYILIFILGVIMGMMFFMTFPFIMLLLVVDLFTLCISDMVSIYSLIKGLATKNMCSKVLPAIAFVCQFVWCADIISLLIVAAVNKIKKTGLPITL